MTANACLRPAFVSCAAILLLAGCDSQSPGAKSKPEVEREPTAAEIRAQFDAVLQPLHAFVASADADSSVPPEMTAQLQTQLDERKKKFASAKAYREGTDGVVTKLEDSLRVARDRQNGVLVLYLCELIKYFDPGNSRVVRFEKWGETVKNRPVVTIRGWYEPRDTTVRIIYAFLEVHTPEDGQTHHIQVREEEEFLGLKYVRIIGKKRGIVFEYLKTKDRFEVYSRSWLRQQ